jgi:hypothetical protein
MTIVPHIGTREEADLIHPRGPAPALDFPSLLQAVVAAAALAVATAHHRLFPCL